ncbi:MAG: putative membrane protein [uncultured bacterium]|nr:MAG: putative membrane protein [uncultured bacterium]
MFYSPLKNSVFRAVWLVMFFSNVGTWAHTVTSSIFITTLTTSTILITLVQTASMLPIFLFSIPAGVLADFFDRKSIVIGAQIVMAIVAFSMAMITFADSMTPSLLIATTFLLNIGLAFNQPAWQATSSTLVPSHEIKQSAALNNLSFNVSRCIGPAIAGYYFSQLGPACLFILNGISFVVAIFVLNKKLLPKENRTKVTFRQVRNGFLEGFFLYKKFPQIKFVFLKAIFYFLFASSIWALLPYIIIVYNKLPDTNLGLLTGMAGIGAILNAYSIYYLRKRLADHQLTTVTLFLSAIVIFFIGQVSSFSALALIMLLFGYSWSIAVSVFNGILQSEFPVDVRSRLIGMYCVCFAGSQALGGYLSGVLVHTFGLPHALIGIAFSLFIIFSGYVLSMVFLNKTLANQYEPG